MFVDLWAVGDWYPFGGDRARRVQALGANFYYFFFLFRARYFFFLSLFLGENLASVFCSCSRRWLARIEGKKKKKDEPMRSRERKESVGFFASLSLLSSSSSKFSFFC